ncbi:MAG: UPF0236 family transposase-like protein [Gammaproteobacteria bacterium]
MQELEMLLRLAFFKSAQELFERLLQESVDRIDAQYQAKPGMHYKERRPVTIQSIFGPCRLTRDCYYLPAQNRGHCPADAALALEAGCTPALFRLISLEGADEASFQKAEEHLKETGGIEVSARQIQRAIQHIGPAAQRWQEQERSPESCQAPIMYVSGDGTGVPMRGEELSGRKGKQPDGTAKTRQAYLGCVFTQLLEALFGKKHPDIKKLLSRWQRWLLQDRVQKIIQSARTRSQGQACQEAVSKALHYFEHNVSRMQYGTFRKLGYFIGSGVVEAGCKTIIGSRCKQSGMFWSEPGAENVLALRCIRSSRQWQNFWKNRANEHAARNDILSLPA